MSNYKTYKVIESNIEYEVVKGADGTKEWFHKGQFHRIDGPAIEYPNGTKSWFHKGQYHRTNGPAYEGANGTKEWYINGKELTEQQFKRYQTYMTLLSKATTPAQRESAQLLLNTITNFKQDKKNKK
jgi:hypothetical protein